jgi:prepilin-type N-terminal cleavage/methylation domain-containing protein
MSLILQKLGLNAQTVAALVSKPIVAAPVVKAIKKSKAKVYQPRPKVIDETTKHRVYNTSTRKRLPIHTSRDTLPKMGTVREDGYVYRAGMAKIRPDGNTVYQEYWMSPAAVEKQRTKNKEKHPLPLDNQKYPTHDGTKPKPTQWKRGDVGQSGKLFARYYLYKQLTGKTVWHESWLSPNSIAGNALLNRKRVNKKSAFTLTELLSVVSIMAIVLCFIGPSISRGIRHARASIENTRQFHAQRIAAAWDGDTTNEIFSVSSYNQMTNTTEVP